jgi:DNA repair protein RecN (Recombination protein N)
VLTEGPPVLVFDEVDAGIGGAAAQAVGRSLGAIAGDHQVLVVTHLAQVAASADAQLVVDKQVEGDTTVTTVVEVAGDARTTELARMLSGTPDSEAARDHARELLAPPKGTGTTTSRTRKSAKAKPGAKGR